MNSRIKNSAKPTIKPFFWYAGMIYILTSNLKKGANAPFYF
jgi:hypothetical protein